MFVVCDDLCGVFELFCLCYGFGVCMFEFVEVLLWYRYGRVDLYLWVGEIVDDGYWCDVIVVCMSVVLCGEC